jgi:hypothetical protein
MATAVRRCTKGNKMAAVSHIQGDDAKTREKHQKIFTHKRTVM